MFRDTTDLTRRVPTKHLVKRNQKPLQAKRWLATTLLVAITLTSSAVTAATGEQFCTHGGQNPVKGDSVACYSDAGCRFAASLGAEPVRDFSPSSAPFALARGKITGIVTSSSGLITQIRKAGGSCRRL
jgi:Asp/Glu/hydantoin racemase